MSHLLFEGVKSANSKIVLILFHEIKISATEPKSIIDEMLCAAPSS